MRSFLIKEISAVVAGVSRERSAVVIVDNDEKVIYGQLYVSGPRKDEFIKQFAAAVIAEIDATYQQAAATAMRNQRTFPDADGTLNAVREIIFRKIRENEKKADR